MIWSVAIVTRDFKLAYNARLALNKKYEFTHITFKEVQSTTFDLIITTVKEFHQIDVKNKIALDNSMKKNEIIAREPSSFIPPQGPELEWAPKSPEIVEVSP